MEYKIWTDTVRPLSFCLGTCEDSNESNSRKKNPRVVLQEWRLLTGKDEPVVSGPWSESNLQDNLCWAVFCWKDRRGQKERQDFFSRDSARLCGDALIFVECPLTRFPKIHNF